MMVTRHQFTDDEYKLVSDGCGSCSLRNILHNIPLLGCLFKFCNTALEPACRKHDFRYACGYQGRLAADFLLLWDGLVFLFANPKYFFLPLPVLLLYVVILLATGWYTFTRFSINGNHMTRYSTKHEMLQRAKMRKMELNPGASYNERNRRG